VFQEAQSQNLVDATAVAADPAGVVVEPQYYPAAAAAEDVAAVVAAADQLGLA
jgi:hypothetical protein